MLPVVYARGRVPGFALKDDGRTVSLSSTLSREGDVTVPLGAFGR